ncbi:DUF1150 family protein [Falsirhodobacter halotolerans]|uniref:DUF1150 family protein n=1 Tax=Falsirhodobacter halotolerans TaxID=1146892 RepID=UPI001FCF9B45|nr:DUF1150 family protein [Falsirhodobacter halotolerans]MCJ8138748.1 DUF1150 domain-containing protein [Falsirhodobacter halotolerans]
MPNVENTQTDRMVYVRPVAVADLPSEVQDQAEGLDILYALHSASGEQIALVRDRKMAFQLAIQNDLAPVNVH